MRPALETRTPPEETILQEANRRRVFRVAGAYVAVSFAVLEGILTAVHLAYLPEWAFRAVLGVALLGFPAAMVLAWDYDITPRGIERTPDDPPDEPVHEPPLRRWVALVLGSTLAGVVLSMLRHAR